MSRDLPYIELLMEMLSIPAVSREEQQRSDFLEAYMKALGWQVKRIHNNLLVGETEAPGTTLLLNSHMDTVPPVDAWESDPFSPQMKGEKIIGLGSNDAGGPLVALPEVFPTGLDEISRSNVSVYPNPAQNFLNVKGLELNNTEVQIFDISGRIVNASLFKVNNSTIDISSLAKGTYHLVLSNNSEKVDTVKFLKF